MSTPVAIKANIEAQLNILKKLPDQEKVTLLKISAVIILASLVIGTIIGASSGNNSSSYAASESAAAIAAILCIAIAYKSKMHKTNEAGIAIQTINDNVNELNRLYDAETPGCEDVMDEVDDILRKHYSIHPHHVNQIVRIKELETFSAYVVADSTNPASNAPELTDEERSISCALKPFPLDDLESAIIQFN